MPFCTQCGTRVDDSAAYCAQCGMAQPKRPPGQPPPLYPARGVLDGISERNASILCYIPFFGVIPAIAFLASQKFRHNQRVRFDGFQSVYLFVAHLIASATGVPFHHNVGSVFETIISICWIFLLVKAAQNQQVHLPIVGDLAARSASEQL